MDIPNADKHRHIEKSGYLQKLCGRSFPYLHQWRRRYCVLSKGKLFFYEKEDSRGSDKSSGVIDLKYFDHVIEASSKDAKKATNVFVITAQDRSFFDPGRYLLSAETLTDMNDWIQRLREALEQIKNNNRPLRKDERKEAALLKEASKDTTHQSSPGKKDEDQVDSKRSKMDNPAAASAFEKRKAELHARLAAPKASSSIQARSSALKMEDDGKGKFNRAPQDELCPLKDDAKPLESITKYRAKGPAGRRAPNARRTALMKQRASSLSALQQGHPGEDPTRQVHWEGGSQATLEPCDDPLKAGINTSHPALAYMYSSDEESETEQNLLLDTDDFLGVSASALNRKTPSPPPRTFSYNIDVGPNSFNQLADDKTSRRNSASLTYQCEKSSQDPLEYRSLPRPPGRISSGRSSPVMDVLENHLMNQSVQHIASPEDNLSDPESSEVSTCKGTHQQRCTSSNTDNLEEFSNALIRLSGTLQHIQEHTASLDARTKCLEKDVKTVANLPTSADQLRKEMDHLAESVAFVSQEASRARIDLMTQRQETERIHRETQLALADAEKSRQELYKTKKEYEILIKELHSLISSIKATMEVSSESPKAEPQTKTTQEKKHSTVDSDSYKRQNKNEKERSKRESESKKQDNGKEKVVGYQSFFQRPTSLIYGLTNRNISKTVSFGEKDKKDREKQANNADLEDKKMKNKNTSLDRKLKNDKLDSQTAERKSKSSKKISETGTQKKDSQSQTKLLNTEYSKYEERHNKRLERSPVLKSLEDLPMMDESSFDSPYERSHVAYGISHVSINVCPPSTEPKNFAIEKCSSSPVIIDRSCIKPSHLNIPVSAEKEINQSPSSSPSPESARRRALSKRMDKKIGKMSQAKRHSDSAAETRHVSNGVSRTSSPRSSYSEKSSTSRPAGVFAISRQSSSPNIPAQRTPSSSFPIQRQLSLGTVPEEGLLPRQESLMSVPEERPIVDRTLPLSPTSSMISFPLESSLSASGGLNVRNSMEQVTGPVISGSSFQESTPRQIPPSTDFHGAEIPLMTSSLKKANERKKRGLGVVV